MKMLHLAPQLQNSGNQSILNSRLLIPHCAEQTTRARQTWSVRFEPSSRRSRVDEFVLRPGSAFVKDGP